MLCRKKGACAPFSFKKKIRGLCPLWACGPFSGLATGSALKAGAFHWKAPETPLTPRVFPAR